MGDEIVLKSPFNFDVAVVRPDFQSHLGLLVRAEATCDIFNPILKLLERMVTTCEPIREGRFSRNRPQSNGF